MATKSGAPVMAVEVGGPAARAGLKAGDVIVALDGQLSEPAVLSAAT